MLSAIWNFPNTNPAGFWFLLIAAGLILFALTDSRSRR